MTVTRPVVFTAVTLKNVVFWDVSRVALVRADVSEEHIASIIRMTKIGEVGTKLAITTNRKTHGTPNTPRGTVGGKG
jgi:hypothetical protein